MRHMGCTNRIECHMSRRIARFMSPVTMMPRRGSSRAEINREEVLTMAAVGAQLVETLPASQYEEERLPGAINIPLKKLDSRTAATLDRNRPVIVYCYDYQ